MISVVMPIFNAERFLAEAMDSLLAQTYPHFEIIAVDDGSTDTSVAILERFAQKDSRVRVVRQEHAGISAAMNRGIALSTRPWIARMDADDVAAPDRFARQLTAARQQPHVVVWGSFAEHINTVGRVLGLSRTGPTSEEAFDRLRAAGKDIFVVNPTAMLRRDIVERVGGYDGRFTCCEDFELFDRMAEHGPIIAIAEPLVQYRVHATSVSMQKFFTMRRFAHYVHARQNARLAGQELTLEQFKQNEKRRSTIRRTAATIHSCSNYFYRRAGLAAAEGATAKAVAFLLISTLLNPAYSIPRFCRQVISPKVRWMLGIQSLVADDVPKLLKPARA
jgi:glycosyltransferase involved in cell wall biosynthesis